METYNTTLTIPQNNFNIDNPKQAHFLQRLYSNSFVNKHFSANSHSRKKMDDKIWNYRKVIENKKIYRFDNLLNNIDDYSADNFIDNDNSLTFYSNVSNWENFTHIHSDELIKYYGKHPKYGYTSVVNSLQEKGMISIDNSYSNFNNSYTKSYSLREPYYSAEPTSYKLDTSRFSNKLRRMEIERREKLSPLLRTIEDMMYLFGFDYKAALEYISNTNYKNKDALLARKKATYILKHKPFQLYKVSEGSKVKRLYTPYTQMPSDLRQFITYENLTLCDIDVANCVPYLLNSFLYDIKHLEDVKLYAHLTGNTDDDFYGEIQRVWNNLLGTTISRYDAKVLIMVVLYGSGNSIKEYRQVFEAAFPNVYKRIQSIKRHGRKMLACMLMNLEAEIMIQGVAGYAVENNMILLPIHDGLITPEKYVENLTAQIKERMIKRVGIEPKIKIKKLN